MQRSTRAELQRWAVDVEQEIEPCEAGGYRQIYQRQAPFDVDALAAEIVQRQPDNRLRWYEDGRVVVMIGKVLPNLSAVKQTLAGRKKRFRAALKERLVASAWQECRGKVYQR